MTPPQTKTTHQKTCDILQSNPLWKDFIGDEKVASKYVQFRSMLGDMTPEERRVNPLHEATPALESLVLAFYPHIGIGGIMSASLYVGGDNMMKSVGHYVGQLVASSLIHIPQLPIKLASTSSTNIAVSPATTSTTSSTSSKAYSPLKSMSQHPQNYHYTKERINEALEFRHLLQVLSTHTMTWRSSIHGSMWGMIQRLESIGLMSGSNEMRWRFVLSEDACGAYAVSNPFFFTSCLHGFGHGVHLTHLLSLEKGVEVCAALASMDLKHATDPELAKYAGMEAELIGQCATGVFMEFGDLSNGGLYESESSTLSGWISHSKIAPSKSERVAAQLNHGLSPQLCAKFSSAGRAVSRACFFRRFSSPRNIPLSFRMATQAAQKQNMKRKSGALRGRKGAAGHSGGSQTRHIEDKWENDDMHEHPYGLLTEASVTSYCNKKEWDVDSTNVTSNIRADCLYGLAKATFAPKIHKMRHFCALETKTSISKKEKKSFVNHQNIGPSHYEGGSRKLSNNQDMKVPLERKEKELSHQIETFDHLLDSSSSSSSSSASSLDSEKTYSNVVHTMSSSNSNSGSKDLIDSTVTYGMEQDVESAAMCVHGAMSMLARVFEAFVEPEPRATEGAMRLMSSACAGEWPQQNDGIANRMKRACAVGGRSLQSFGELANIAWCESCPPLKSPLPTISNTSTSQFYSHVPSPQYLITSQTSSSLASSAYTSESASSSLRGSEEVGEGPVTSFSIEAAGDWEMQWLFESAPPRPGGLSSLDSFFSRSMIRNEAHDMAAGFGSSTAGPFAVQNMVVVLLLCALFGCLCRVTLFGGEEPPVSNKKRSVKS